jgi:serine/threonine protein kinase
LSEDFPVQLAGLRPGSLVAGYRLEAQVGAGGMAVVFRARDERLGRLVALKVLAPALASDPGFRRRFIAESRAAAAVDDPHIIPIYEAGEAAGALFIAMRFVGGGDLRHVLAREGALTPGRAAWFISPVAWALDAAHRAGLVHRDVKPANMLVDAREDRPDHVYLSDFGVSKGATASVSLTGAGNFLGTPDYSAPEQIQGQAIDGRTDQYALACVAYQLLTGSAPFERDQGMAVLLAHLSEPPPSLVARRPDLPAAADLVLARGLAKVPEKRFGSCADFAGALREALGLAPYTSLGSTPASPLFPIASSAGLPLTAGSATLDPAPNGGQAWPPTAPGLAGTGGPAGPRGAAGPTGPERAPRRSWSRRLAPLGVVAALAAVAATVLLIIANPKPKADARSGPTPHVLATESSGPTPRASGTGRTGPTPHSSGTETTSPSPHATATGLTYAEGGRVPPYYVWITANGNPNTHPLYASVRLTATGAVLGTVNATAPDSTIAAVTGAADDRTFVLDEQPRATGNANQSWEPRTFYLLSLGADGAPSSVTPLPITEPSGSFVTGFALSADGTELAVAVQPNSVKSEPDLTQLKLYSIATGAVLRTWNGNGTIGFGGDDPEALTWTSDKQTLAFVWEGAGTDPQQGEWLLNAGLGGSDLLGDSREALGWSNTSSYGSAEDLIISPDGSVVICGSVNDSSSAPESGFYEFATASGNLVRTVAHWAANGSIDVLWSNAAGSVLVGEASTAANSSDQVGMITAGTFTPLPGLGPQQWADEGAW